MQDNDIKFVSACYIARKLGISIFEDSEDLYAQLGRYGFYWDVKSGIEQIWKQIDIRI